MIAYIPDDELQRLGLKQRWEKTEDGEFYYLNAEWWQSFTVFGSDDEWLVSQSDHDAGLNEDGTTYTSHDTWDERFKSWSEAAKVIEERYYRR